MKDFTTEQVQKVTAVNHFKNEHADYADEKNVDCLHDKMHFMF